MELYYILEMKMDSDAFTRFRNRGEPTNGQSCSPTKAIMRCSGKFATAYWSTYHQPVIWVKHSFTPKHRTVCVCSTKLQHSDFHSNIQIFVQFITSDYQGPTIEGTVIDYDDVLQTILG